MDSEAFGRFLVILGATTLIGVIWLILFSTSKGWDLFWSMASIIGSFIIISGVIVIFDILHSRYNDPKKPINSQGRIQEKSITKKPKKRGYLNRAVFLTVASAALGSVFGMFYQSYASNGLCRKLLCYDFSFRKPSAYFWVSCGICSKTRGLSHLKWILKLKSYPIPRNL